MTINAVYTAREDFKKKEAYNEKLMDNLKKGIWESNSIYIINDSLVKQSFQIKKDNDLFLSVDGYNLYIPNGALDPQLNNLNMDLYSFKYKVGTVVEFGAGGNSSLFKGAGWSLTEEKSTWTEGKQSDLEFILNKPETDLVFSIKMSPLIGGDIKEQKLIVYANNHKIKEISIKDNDIYRFDIPKSIITNQLKIVMVIPNASSPQSLNMSEDQRILGVAVENLRIDSVEK